MTAATRVYRGPLVLVDGAEPELAEVWRRNGTAVAFVDGVDVAAIVDPVFSLSDDRRLVINGADHSTGEPARWEGHGPERVAGQWPGVTVSWPGTPVVLGAPTSSQAQSTVTWSQYGVRVSRTGHASVDLPAARTEVVGGQRWIVNSDGTRFAAAAPRRGCGCGK